MNNLEYGETIDKLEKLFNKLVDKIPKQSKKKCVCHDLHLCSVHHYLESDGRCECNCYDGKYKIAIKILKKFINEYC